jgi:hypothetical protein
MFAAIAAASRVTTNLSGRSISPRRSKTMDRSIATPARRAYRAIVTPSGASM